MMRIEARASELMLKRVVWPSPLPCADQPSEFAEGFRIEAERLADFARSGLAPVGDDVGSHGCAKLAIAGVHVLNRLLALVTGRKIEIDVRPLTAILRQKAFKEQFHAYGIDSRNLQRITNSRVGGAATTLYENAVPLAIADDVPDDEEVSGKT